MLAIFQILLVLFCIFAIVGVLKRKEDNLLGPKGALFWIFFWVAVAIVVVWPNIVQRLADYIGIGRGVDLVTYLSISAIFYLLFKLHVKMESLKRDFTKVIRQDSLDQLKKK
ncbi:MAG: DUF2304 domain-containing protein [Candidatus Magasanikbacteria bacterium CG_4_10_14_0_2_um_filter_37_12]|uniref:DUF2304 domain-containing protein n=1 Tax=Candidatus Magasanikbacteria bacterium CG_4_10_14_0_2_um_filter_37_12 TaxID=1974637 RepID=A0A2M7V8C2_9BACT|nr:MAG: DUF2304 domain-containing protein [Candidatus Magasanikbacteria bacterium CG_4_10_14_0_2_um_filter_37_12]